jgi:hypothetical protein
VFEIAGQWFVSRFLHNYTAQELQNRLQMEGLSLMILPIWVSAPAR